MVSVSKVKQIFCKDPCCIAFWILRIALALTYLYSGVSLILRPTEWLGFAPAWFKDVLYLSGIELTTYLKMQGVIELLFVASLLTGFGLRIVALLSAFEMAGITLLYGVDGISFRDIAILGSSLAVFALSFGKGTQFADRSSHPQQNQPLNPQP